MLLADVIGGGGKTIYKYFPDSILHEAGRGFDVKTHPAAVYKACRVG